MNAHYRFYPLPRPSLKTEISRHCSCNSESCKGSECSSRNMSYTSESSSSSSSTPPYPPQPPSPHVHFLGLCQTYFVDYDYDRSSTVVMPNECALPARGCPGRTYFSTAAHGARPGRRLGRCATPAASRANSRTRNNNMSPPPSPSFYAKHIFYPEEYPFPSPVPSPRGPAPQLVPDTCMSPGVSDDSDVGLSTPPEAGSQVPSPPSLSRRGSGNSYSSSGGSPSIDAPGHPPIPGYISPNPRAMGDMFSITNALNGLELTNGSAYDSTGPWSLPTKRSKDSDGSHKKVKTKKSRSNMHLSSFRTDTGVLGGF